MAWQRWSGWMMCAAMAAVAVGQTRAPGNETILRDQLKADLYFLAGDGMKGRLTGTPEAALSAQWAESRFERLHLKGAAGGGSFIQEFGLMAATGLGERNRVAVVNGPQARVGRVKEDFYPHFFSPAGRARAGVVFVGFGIDAPKLGWNDWKLDVRGKVALVLTGEPGADDPKSIFDGVVTSIYSDPLRKVLSAQEHGAVAVALVTPGASRFSSAAHGYWPAKRPHLERYALTTISDKLQIPVVEISPALAQVLLGDRKLAAVAKDAEAASGGYAGIALGGHELEVETDVAHEIVVGRNVVAMIEGTDPKLKDEAVIVSAHYDHNGAADGQIFNGADDNGSGTVALMEIAEAFSLAAAERKKPRRTVIFANWDAEERCCGPLLGAWAWSETPKWPLEKTAAVLNMDMVGRNEEVPQSGGPRFRGLSPQTAESNANAVNLIGYSYSEDMRGAALKANEFVGLTLRQRYDNNRSNLLRRSDQWIFLNRGVPSLFFHTGLHPDYHTVYDRPEKINYEKLEKVARIVHQLAWDLANAEGRPKMPAKRVIPPLD